MFKNRIEADISEATRNLKIKELIQSIEENNLKELLFGKVELEHEEHPCKNRTTCNENPEESAADENEGKIIRCLFYKNKEGVNKTCEDCKFKNKHKIEGEYFITDYRVPAFYQTPEEDNQNGIGTIDLVISDGTTEYATEIKPYRKSSAQNNDSPLLKMIAEILTYTYGFPENKYKPAIAFFEDTPQELEWMTEKSQFEELLEKAGISVFLFKETQKEKEKFTIEKLK